MAEQIAVDFQGWPICKKTLAELLFELGAQEYECDGKKVIGFPVDEAFLSIYPTTLEDDGMGYGVREMFITGIDCDKDKNIVHIWRDVGDKQHV